MFHSWRIGRVLDIPIHVKSTFLLLLAVVFLAYGGLAGVAMVLLAFASIVLHELGHAVAARALGVRVMGIDLGFLGGAARMELPSDSRRELLIAAAGPAVSLALAGLGIALGVALGAQLLVTIGIINFVIAAFNLIPALPMDGGRILRAALAPRFGYERATLMAVTIARGFVIAFAIVGIWFGAWRLLIIAPALWLMGTQERALAQTRVQQERMRAMGWDDDVSTYRM